MCRADFTVGHPSPSATAIVVSDALCTRGSPLACDELIATAKANALDEFVRRLRRGGSRQMRTTKRSTFAVRLP